MLVSEDLSPTFEDGWREISVAIDKLVRILDQVDDDLGTGGAGTVQQRCSDQEWSNRRITPFTPAEYVAVYTKCYNMCTRRDYNWSERLYARHGETIHKYLTDKVLPVLKQKHGESLLKGFVLRWKYHQVMNKWMRKFFMYLDRYYVRHHAAATLHDSSIDKFRNIVFNQVYTQCVKAILAEIDKEREGEVVDRDLLKRCVAVFTDLGDKTSLYEEKLEKPLLENSREFYKIKSQDWVQVDTLPAYLIKAQIALESERERVDNYLEPSTKSKLQEACDDELLKIHEATLLEKEGCGLRFLLENDQKDDLERLYRLYCDIPGGLAPIAVVVKKHITKMGVELVERREAAHADGNKTEKDTDPTFVQSLLDLHDKYESMVLNQFKNSPTFHKVMKESFEYFLNMDLGKVSAAEMISVFCDRVLRTGGVKFSDEKIEEYLEKCVKIFGYLHDKDLFGEAYRNQLAKRLLMGRSSSTDAEMSMIGKLKYACGAHFTSKLEGMMKDLLTGNDLNKSFKESVENTTNSEGLCVSRPSSGDHVLVDGVEFSVNVLTSGHWPTPKTVSIGLPTSLRNCIQVFEKYYSNRHSHRDLNWAISLSTNTIRANFSRTYDLQLTTLQSVALLQFNDVLGEWLSYTDLSSRLGCETEVLKRIMHSLSCGKYKVLIKDPPGKRVDLTDRFKVNNAFQSNMRKIRIPMASLEESHNPKRVEQDRSIAIEAAIVRIMKARKALPHTQLVAEVIQQLTFFKPESRTVKRRIEHLIEREYLERDQERPSYYKYLA